MNSGQKRRISEKVITFFIFFILTIVLIVLVISSRKLKEYHSENQEIIAESNRISSLLKVEGGSSFDLNNSSRKQNMRSGEAILNKLSETNPDVYGVLILPNLDMNFPVVLSDSGEYLKKNFEGEKSSSGTVFINRSELEVSKKRIILNAHNMKNGSMFGFLKKYEDAEYADKNPEIEWITRSGRYQYLLCGYINISANNEKIQEILIESDSSVRELKELIGYNGKLIEEFSREDQLLILATCEYTRKNGRLLVIYKRI